MHSMVVVTQSHDLYTWLDNTEFLSVRSDFFQYAYSRQRHQNGVEALKGRRRKWALSSDAVLTRGRSSSPWSLGFNVHTHHERSKHWKRDLDIIKWSLRNFPHDNVLLYMVGSYTVLVASVFRYCFSSNAFLWYLKLIWIYLWIYLRDVWD